MAKAGQLAGLAALGALAYMNRDKLGMGDKGGLDREEQTGKLARNYREARPDSTETREAPRRQITDYQAKAPLDGTEMYPSGVLGGARLPDDTGPSPVAPRNAVTGSNLPPAKLKSVSTPSDKSIQLAPQNRDLETNMSRGTRTPAAPDATVNSVSSTAEGMKNYKPRRPVVASSTEEGMKNYKPRRPVPPTAPAVEKKKPFMPEMPNMGYKKGGAVKKMASGGMTSKTSPASKRADGIASKGKTRCKMY